MREDILLRIAYKIDPIVQVNLFVDKVFADIRSIRLAAAFFDQ